MDNLEQKANNWEKRKHKVYAGIAAIGIAIGTMLYSGLMAQYNPPKSEGTSQVSGKQKRTWPERVLYHGKKNASKAYDRVNELIFGSESEGDYIGKE